MQSSSKSIQIVIDEFIDYKKASGHFSELTAHNVKLRLLRFAKFLNSKRVFNTRQLSKNHIVAWLSKEFKNVNHNTKITILRQLNSFCDFLVENEYAVDNEAKRIKIPSAKYKEASFLYDDEIELLYETVDKHSYPSQIDRNLLIISLLLFPMLRVRELVGLKISDVDLEHLKIAVNRKGGKKQFLPINERQRELFLNYYEFRKAAEAQIDYVFLSQRKKPITVSQVQHLVKRFLSLAEIIKDHMGPHLLRHSGASYLLRNGVDIKTVSFLMGHFNISTTHRYVHVHHSSYEAAAKLSSSVLSPHG